MVRAERVCAWCGKSMGTVDAEFDPTHRVTHGICAGCGCGLLQAGEEIPAQEFLDRLGLPVLVVDAQGRPLAASGRARELLGRDFPYFPGFTGGAVIDCVHSDAEDGCGGPVLCRSRVISRAVAETFETGRACVAMPAYPDARSGEAGGFPRLKVSTEKVDGCVVLRVEE